MRPIDADALIEEYDRVHVGPPGRARKLIEDAPTIETERKTGRWIIFDSDKEKYDDIKCSNCKMNFTVDAYRWCDIGFTVDDLKYCPNCGLKMEK